MTKEANDDEEANEESDNVGSDPTRPVQEVIPIQRPPTSPILSGSSVTSRSSSTYSSSSPSTSGSGSSSSSIN